MALQLKRTGSAEYGQYLKVLLCGSPGSGKTRLSSTFPNPLYASAEGGLMSIADRNIPYLDIKSSTDLHGVKAVCDQDPGVRKELLGVPVDTIVIDTIDEIQRILIKERLEDTKKESLTLPDWGWLGEQMQALIRGFRNLDMNVVMTCHMKESTDSESGRMWFEPGLQGAIGKQIPAFVDLALLLRTGTQTTIENGTAVKKTVRFLVSAPDAHHDWIKDRSGKLPAEMLVDFDTDFARLHEAIYGGTASLPESTSVDVEEPKLETEETVHESHTPPADSDLTEPVVQMPNVILEQEIYEEPTPVVLPQEEPEIEKPEETVVSSVPTTPVAVSADTAVCEVCEDPVSEDQRDISKIRYRKILCATHFKAAKTTRR